ncbi:hypothetical protein [Bacillus altitudinis]|uniref:hypothetical protein n=1 Tax=Bacillus altitudinis TaxID=293387 RepID=UPI0015F292C2|nr:hypothetical protein [Bacillus altitudinis]
MNNDLSLQKLILKKMFSNKMISEDVYNNQLSSLQKKQHLHDFYNKNRDDLVKETKKQILEYNK